MVIKSRRAYESDDISSFVNRKTTVNHNNVLNNEMPKSSFHQRRHSEGEFRKKVNLRQNCEQRHHPAEESHARKNHIPKIMFQTPPRPKSNINRQKCKSTGARALIKNCHFRERQFSTAGSNKSVVDQNMFCTPPKPRAIIFEERCHSTGDCKRRIFQDNDSALANSDIRDKSLPKTEFRCASKPVSLTGQQRSKCTKDDKRRHCAQNETRLNRYLPMTGNIHQSYRQNPFEDEKDSKDQYQKPKSLFNNLEKMQEVSFGSARTSFLPRSEIINFQSSEHDTRDATNENRSQRLTYKRDKAPPNQSSPLIAHRDGDISNHIRTTSQPENFIIRSSEMEPTLHQMNIPPAENIVIHSRVCSMMERYDVLKAYQGSQDKLFDFSELIGLSRSEIRRNTWNNAIISNVTPDIDDMDLKDTVFPLNQKLPMNKDKGRFHPSVVKALFDCADDLVVEGYFQSDNSSTGSQEESKENTRIQASVFSSHKHRQFIVCFRGSDEEQAKPISKSKTNQQLGEKESLLHPNQPVSIHPKFRATYFTKQIEMQVFRLLIDLSDFNPFYDVVMTGHSYGGALATIGAIRFAALFPMMTVSCHAFGTPKVGGIAFRHFANSLPNLKVIRIEHGSDPYVHLPEGKSKWMHVGHTITIESSLMNSTSELSNSSPFAINQNSKIVACHIRNHQQIASSNSNIISTPTKLSKKRNSLKRCSSGNTENCNGSHKEYGVLAYRFDEKRPERTFWTGVVKSLPKKSAMAKRDHEIKSYIHALDRYTQSNLPWVTQFVGEEGKGVSGADDEVRCVV